MSEPKRILCIEDQSEMVDLFRMILEQNKFQVSGAMGGAEGIKQARAQKPDVILLDLMMPGMDGWEVFKQLKTDPTTQNIPIVVVTARSEGIDKLLGLHIAKVEGYITKPFGPKELVESVSRVLGKSP
ncbi:MAG: response regulator [Chloroflexi bacterium]|nr:response regulator [Chloroflexota bacterium]